MTRAKYNWALANNSSKTFRNPSNRHTQNPETHELVASHIQSFNTLFRAQDGSPSLINLAVGDLLSKFVFESRNKAKDGTALPRNRLKF
ncbi:hypothetical protein BY996DRAFT_6468269 [Phakopsora pachyrhizi]|nr:hypothetical protein BY996DRAFT_6468269 [Phakopsora pachyrhizi]